ncbi:restriction endonuclease subunit R, partial [Bacillus pseudomycoides]
MAYQPEAELEKKLHTQLVNQSYKSVKIADYDALLANFKQQLNTFNEHKLNGKPLTNIEFKRILTLIEGKSIYDSAKILRDKLLIEREDGTQLYVEL